MPIVIDVNNVIIAGHTRHKASQQLKLEEVPCLVANDLTDEQIKAFRIADNSTAQLAEWDIDLLNIELSDITLDMSEIGLDEQLKDIEKSLAREVEEDEVPEVNEEDTITKLGDVWKLGNHRLMCGDSTKEEDVKKLIGEHKVNLLITDPPYNVAYEGKTKDKLKIQNDKMSDNSFFHFLVDSLINAQDAMVDGACFYIWHADSEGMNFRASAESVGLKVRQCLIWNKNTIVMGRQDYHWKHEPCLYGWKDGAAHKWCSDRKQSTVIEWEKPTRNGEHPTMKPVGLFQYQICNNTDKGDLVLDIFAGSGTALIACENSGRKSFNMELDPKYCDVIIKRWENLTGIKAELI